MQSFTIRRHGRNACLAMGVLAIGTVGGLSRAPARAAEIGPIDIVGNLPPKVYEYFILPNKDIYRDWGNEPFVAVNPKDPTKIVVSSFAFGAQPGSTLPKFGLKNGPKNDNDAFQASLWYSSNAGQSWDLRCPLPPQGAKTSLPGDQTFAYDANGVLHGAVLNTVYAPGGSPAEVEVRYGSTTDPDKDGFSRTDLGKWVGGDLWSGYTGVHVLTNEKKDQPWIAVQPKPGDPAKTNLWIGYTSFNPGDDRGMHVAKADTPDLNFKDAFINTGGLPPSGSNPGVRVATDTQGRAYALYSWATADNAGVKDIQYRLNRNSGTQDAWDFTGNQAPGGKPVAGPGKSYQGDNASFGGVNALKGSITAIAADKNGDHIYAVYGMREQGKDVDNIYLQEFHPKGNDLEPRGNPTLVSSGLSPTALPSVAVTDDGNVWVMYDIFNSDNKRFSVRLAESLDQGKTFSKDSLLRAFTAPGKPKDPGFPIDDRILGDYQGLLAVGNEVCGTFAATGDVKINKEGVPFDTTTMISPWFFCVPEPGTLLLLALGGLLGARGRTR